jgi:hypothetical protein
MTFLERNRFFLYLFIVLVALPFSTLAAPPPPPAQQRGLDLVIVLDRSGSMTTTDPQGLSIPAACFLIEQLALGGEGNRAAVVPFNNRAVILGQEQAVPATALSANLPGLAEWLLASSMESFHGFRESSQADSTKFHLLLREQMKEKGNTELGLSLDLAAAILQSGGQERRKMVVLISDGQPEPDLSDGKRSESLVTVLGKENIAAARNNRRWGMEALKKFAQYILDTSVNSLAEKGITVYPVAFQQAGHDDNFLINYLETIKEKTTGNRNIRQATAANLVEQMMGFIPAGEEYLQFQTMKGNDRLVQSSAHEALKEYEFDLPDITRQARIVLSFPTAKSAQKFQVELFRNGQKVADSEGKIPADMVHAGPVRRDGALAYHSFRFMRPEASVGHWKMRLIDVSKGGTEHLPDTDLLIDIRTDTEFILAFETASGQPRAGEPASLRCKLLGKRKGSEYPLPISSLDVFLVGRMPQELRGVSDRLRDVTMDGPVAIANLPDGIAAPGEYTVEGDIYFNTDPPTRELKVHVVRNITVEPGKPANAWLNKRGSVSASPGPDTALRCDLPPLGDNFSLTFDGLEAVTDAYLPVSGVQLAADPFTHKETGKELNRGWVKLSPISLRGLSAGKPVPLKVEIRLPDQVPADIPDGIYESTLKLRQGSRMLAGAALGLTITIPRFAAEGEDVNAPYLGADREKLITVAHTIRYPGIRGNRVVVPLRSTSLLGIAAQIYIDMAEGADTTSGERTRSLVYSQTTDTFAIPGKNSRHPGMVTLNTNLTDPSLDGKDFENTLTIVAPHHRTRSVRVVSHVRILPAWQPQLVGILFLLTALFLSWRGYRIWRERNLFVGHSRTNLLENTMIRFNGDLLGTFIYDADMLALSFSPGPAAETTLTRYASEEDGPMALSPEESLTLHSYDLLRCYHPRNMTFTLQVIQAPDPTEGMPGYGYEVTESSLGRGGQRFILLAGAMVLGITGVFICIHPYGILPWLGI